MKILHDERGTMIIEATLCMVATMVVLVMILCFGFVVYQRAMMGIVANQVAEEIAVTYKLKNVPDSSDVSESDVAGVGYFRYVFHKGSLKTANETKLTLLAQSRLTKTSLAIDDGGYDVSIKRVSDDIGRAHYEISVTNKYTYLFEGLFSILGMDAQKTLTATSFVADTDILSYINTVHTTQYAISKVPGSDFADHIVSLIHTVMGFFH